MKKISKNMTGLSNAGNRFIHNLIISSLFFTVIISGSCTKDLLEQTPRAEMSSDLFWKKTDDAVFAVNGVYDANRGTFGKDYNWDGAGEFVHTRFDDGYTDYYNPSGLGGNFDFHWRNCYKTINRANDAIENIRLMKPQMADASSLSLINRLEGEARFLRALNYFRLIDLWGDVPFYTKKINNNEAYSMERTSKTVIKDTILADLAYAALVLPKSYPTSDRGRATKMAALSFSGKVKLFWACWMKNDNKLGEASTYYASAALDFKEAMNPTYGLTLFNEGDPGTYQTPNYFKLFQPNNEYASEIIFSVQYGGPLLNQGESILRAFGTRNTGWGECWFSPNVRLVNKYQLISTGGYAPPLVLSNNAATINGSINPKTYQGRDWRMRGTMLWDGEKYPRTNADGTVFLDSIALKFKNPNGVTYINYGGMKSGYVFRKYVRVIDGYQTYDGPQDFYLMRLPDIWLMYCEAVNEVQNGPTDELFTLIDKIRYRGKLPPLDKSKFGSKELFFKAIEQERIVEFVGEGLRFFDLRRWKKVEETWPAPDGLIYYNTWGEKVRDEFKNAQTRDYQRYYIFRIPPAERDVNPKLTQNDPWL
ncbi:MAG: RagB/SusD family nutrient uptake outer membrane protein [Prolixibacteraceae bacterium]|jgi:hypothetical protein|nr:RagB/SusD family nutrient uptake outer membrane protein [Prolixibacteraceae bacterium]